MAPRRDHPNRRKLLLALRNVGASFPFATLGGRARAYSVDDYLSSRDFNPQSGPRGTCHDFAIMDSLIFPGYIHVGHVYVPSKRGTSQPALMVFQDGNAFFSASGAWHVPVVLDNLIAAGEIPPMVAVFIDPGLSRQLQPDGSRQSNRSLEYDSLGPAYTRFVLEELLPYVRQYATWRDDPNGHAIGGHSSGAISAFTVAWTRPDRFRKVYSANGSFTHIRGGDAYPNIVRNTPPKPLRIYQMSDTQDMSTPDWGNWAEANHAMSAALKSRDYDHRFDFIHGTHDPRYAASLFPDAMRWLWRGYR